MRNHLNRRLLLQGGAAAAALLPMAAGAQPGSRTATQPQRGGRLVLTVPEEPHNLNAAFGGTLHVNIAASKVNEALVWFDADLKPQPQLAESWEFSPDGRSLTFRLRKGVKWHDGRDFTSADVAFSLEHVWSKLNPGGRVAYASLVGVEAPDAHTVVLRLAQPAPYLINYLSIPGAQVVPKHIYEGTNIATNPANIAPIGTGPFRFKEWVRGSHIILERNPDYWQPGLPYLDSIVVRFLPDAVARSTALFAGEVHVAVASSIPISNLKRFSDSADFRVDTSDGKYLATILYSSVNVRRPYLADRRVRQALLHALDRAALLRIVYGGYGRVANGPIASTIPAFYSDRGRSYPYDPGKAEELLDAAGVPRKADGRRLKLTLDLNARRLETVRTGEFIKQYLSRIGIDLELRAVDNSVFIRRVFTDYDFDLMLTNMHPGLDPTTGLQRLFWTKNISPGIPWTNGSGYSNPALDQVMEAAAVEHDADRRRALIEQWQEIVREDLPLLSLLEIDWITVSTARYHKGRPQGDGLYASLADAFLQEAR